MIKKCFGRAIENENVSIDVTSEDQNRSQHKIQCVSGARFQNFLRQIYNILGLIILIFLRLKNFLKQTSLKVDVKYIKIIKRILNLRKLIFLSIEKRSFVNFDPWGLRRFFHRRNLWTTP